MVEKRENVESEMQPNAAFFYVVCFKMKSCSYISNKTLIFLVGTFL